VSDDHGTWVKDGVTIVAETAAHAINLSAAGWQQKTTKAAPSTTKADEKK
jgi:hypothetical protein